MRRASRSALLRERSFIVHRLRHTSQCAELATPYLKLAPLYQLSENCLKELHLAAIGKKVRLGESTSFKL